MLVPRGCRGAGGRGRGALAAFAFYLKAQRVRRVLLLDLAWGTTVLLRESLLVPYSTLFFVNLLGAARLATGDSSSIAGQEHVFGIGTYQCVCMPHGCMYTSLVNNFFDILIHLKIEITPSPKKKNGFL